MLSTIFMTIFYVLVGAGAIATWMSINTLILDDMSIQACKSKKPTTVIEDAQGLYTWLTVLIFISFIGVLRGFNGISNGVDTYDVDTVPAILYLAMTALICLISCIMIFGNTIIKNQLKPYTLGGNSTNPIIQDNTTIKSNSVISTSLISIASLSGIAVLAILYHGNEMVKMHKKDNDMSDMTDMSEDDMSLYE